MIVLEEGDKIHLKSKEGMYTVVATRINGLYISCKMWQAINNHPKFIVKKWIEYSDIKCLAGGLHNRRDLQYTYIYSLETKGMLEV